ncbi:MAG: HPP family protein [Candidatus Micrarchaeales archaeon]|nr:HPP family protein [Candidatus Micrarchaeales archaeon]
MAKSRRRAGGAEERKKLINNIIIPAALTTFSLVLLIFVLNYVNFDIRSSFGAPAIIFASFGGSAFLLFMMPKSRTANIRRFVKSYVIAVVLGSIGYFLLQYIGLYYTSALVIFAASILLVVTDSYHASAISLLFAYLLYDISWVGDIVVLIGVVLLLLIRLYLEKYVFVLERDVERLGER